MFACGAFDGPLPSEAAAVGLRVVSDCERVTDIGVFVVFVTLFFVLVLVGGLPLFRLVKNSETRELVLAKLASLSVAWSSCSSGWRLSSSNSSRLSGGFGSGGCLNSLIVSVTSIG